MSIHKFVRGFFWFAFACFLCASIPHVAFFFRAYEPIDAARDVLYWLISYGIALSIDITIFLLSVTVAGLQRQGKSKGLIGSVWVFIIGLALLSWYINFKYAAHFIDTGMISPTAINLPWLGTLPDINPIIASAFQVLAIAYTWISDKIGQDAPVKSAATLKAEADELENAMREKQRIAALKRGGKVSTLTGLFDAGKTVVNHVRKADETQPDNTAITEQDATIAETPAAPVFASEIEAPAQVSAQPINAGIMPTITEQGAPEKPAHNTGIHAAITEQDATKNDSAGGSTSARSVTIKEAARIMGKSEQYVRTLVNNGKLHTAPRNKKLVLKSSIDALITARKDTAKMGAITPLKVVSDEEDSTEQNAGITLGIIEQMMYDALAQNTEELPALLQLANEQGIEELTATLKDRYSEHAGYITEQRVTNVLAYVRQGADEQLSA